MAGDKFVSSFELRTESSNSNLLNAVFFDLGRTKLEEGGNNKPGVRSFLRFAFGRRKVAAYGRKRDTAKGRLRVHVCGWNGSTTSVLVVVVVVVVEICGIVKWASIDENGKVVISGKKKEELLFNFSSVRNERKESEEFSCPFLSVEDNLNSFINRWRAKQSGNGLFFWALLHMNEVL